MNMFSKDSNILPVAMLSNVSMLLSRIDNARVEENGAEPTKKCSEALETFLDVLKLALQDNSPNANNYASLKHAKMYLNNIISCAELELIADILSHMYILWNIKQPFKLILSNCLEHCNLNSEVVETYLEIYLIEAMIDAHRSWHDVENVVGTIQLCCRFSMGKSSIQRCFVQAIEFLTKVLQSYIQLGDANYNNFLLLQPSKCVNSDICITLKCIASVYQKSFLSKNVSKRWITEISQQAAGLCVKLLTEEKFEEVWNSAGLALPALLAVMLSEENFSKKMLMVLQAMDHDHNFGPMGDSLDLELHGLSDTAKLAVVNGVLVAVSCETSSNEMTSTLKMDMRVLVLKKVFQQVKNLGKSSSSAISSQLTVAACFLQWTATLRTVVLAESPWFPGSDTTNWLQRYVADNLDHPVDTLRHTARDVLQNLLHAHAELRARDVDDGGNLGERVVRRALQLNWNTRAPFIMLTCAANHVDVAAIAPDIDLPSVLISAVTDQSLAPHASLLYLKLAERGRCADGKSVHDEVAETTWLRPVVDALRNAVDPRTTRLLLDYFVNKLLKLFGESGLRYLVRTLKHHTGGGDEAAGTCRSLMSCLRVAQQLGLLHEQTGCESESTAWKCGVWKYNIDSATLFSALIHQDGQVRVETFALLMESRRPSRLVTPFELDLVRRALPYSFKCEFFRHKLLPLVKKFLLRLDGNWKLVRREHAKPAQRAIIDLSRFSCDIYRDFFRWLCEFCLDQLFDDACYARRSVALSVFRLVVQRADSDADMYGWVADLADRRRVADLLRLLHDPYDDIRHMALTLLLSSAINQKAKDLLDGGGSGQFMRDLTASALERCRACPSSDACHESVLDLRLAIGLTSSCGADRVFRLRSTLLDHLEEDVNAAETNLLGAVQSRPMYGLLNCARMLFFDHHHTDDERLAQLMSRSLSVCLRVSRVVRPVVCCVSPEGHLPEVTSSALEAEVAWAESSEMRSLVSDESGDERAAAQRVLVACWRSAKESSLLLEQLANCSSTVDGGILSRAEMLEIGHHFRTQLMEARHRGAFEIAYASFKSYCPLLWRSANRALNELPVQWTTETMDMVMNPRSSLGIDSTTRRSAGLPYFLQAILGSSNATHARDHTRRAVGSLLSVVVADDEEAAFDRHTRKVHALNILRGLFRDSSLAEQLLPYVDSALIAAISGSGSRVWAIRNSSTLLFSTLVTRAFGVKREKDLEKSAKNRLSSAEFMKRMPELAAYLLTVVEDALRLRDGGGMDIRAQARLYPALLVLSRVYPSPPRLDQPNQEILAPFVPNIIRCANSAVSKCRTMAAITLANIVPPSRLSSLVRHVTSSLRCDWPSNRLHGALLQLYGLVEKVMSTRRSQSSHRSARPNHDDDDVASFVLEQLRRLRAIGTSENRCTVTRSIYLECFLQAIQSTTCEQALSELELLAQDAVCHLPANDTLHPGSSLLSTSLGRLLVIADVFRLRRRSNGTVATFTVAALTSRRRDVIMSALRSIRNHVPPSWLDAEGGSEGSNNARVWKNEVEVQLIKLAIVESDGRLLAAVYKTMATVGPSLANLFPVFDISLQRAKAAADDKLSRAIIACQAECLTRACRHGTESLLNQLRPRANPWIRQLSTVIDRTYSDEHVRHVVAIAIRRVALEPAFVRFTWKSVTVAGDAAPWWSLLTKLLVDDSADVRRAASYVIHSLTSDDGHDVTVREPKVETVALEECIALMHRVSPSLPDVVIAHVIASKTPAKSSPRDGAAEQLFGNGVDGANGSYLEASVLRSLLSSSRSRRRDRNNDID